MKVKLFRKLIRRGASQIAILSVTTGYKTGMSYSYSGDEYRGLYSHGDTPADVRFKASRIYIREYIKRKRKDKK